MFRIVAFRLLAAVPVLLGAAGFAFLLIRLAPGDPAVALLGGEADETALAALRRELSLDQPLLNQFVVWLAKILAGDLGRSIESGEMVTRRLAAALGPTAILTASAMALAMLIGIPGGVYAATHRRSGAALALAGLSTLGLSLPSFWLGLLLILGLSSRLRLLPASGYVAPGDDLAAHLAHLAMPALTLGVVLSASTLRMTRSAMRQALRAPHIRTALAKGLSRRRILWRHVFPSAAPALVALLAAQFGQLLGGVAVTETMFSWPGVGKLTVEAVFARDYPVIQGAILLAAALTIVVNLLAEAIQAALDPRVRLP